MKLSVKWFAGLAVIALAVVAMVGSTSAAKADGPDGLLVGVDQPLLVEDGQIVVAPTVPETDVGASASTFTAQSDPTMMGTQQTSTTRMAGADSPIGTTPASVDNALIAVFVGALVIVASTTLFASKITTALRHGFDNTRIKLFRWNSAPGHGRLSQAPIASGFGSDTFPTSTLTTRHHRSRGDEHDANSIVRMLRSLLSSRTARTSTTPAPA